MTVYRNFDKKTILYRLKPVTILLCTSFITGCIALDTSLTKMADKSPQNQSVTNNKSKSQGKKPNAISVKNAKWRNVEKQIANKNETKKTRNKANMTALRKSFRIQDRMSINPSKGNLPLGIVSQHFSFKTENIDIRMALRKFASDHQLDIFIDRDIEGEIIVNFKRLSLKKAMALLLGKHNYYWQWDDGLIRISRLQTKIFIIDYLRLTRSSNATSKTKTVSSNTKSNDDEKSASTIQQNDNLAFWDEIEKQVSALISDQGRFVTNRLSGTIQITDTPKRIEEVEMFIDSLQQALHRQVEIEARILEVTLSEDHALGIDWTAVDIQGITGALTNTVTGGNQNLGLKTSTLSLSYGNNKFSALISALEEQGEIRVVSQPRLRILNNQPAHIKVGSDRTFFTQTVNRTFGSTGVNQLFVTDEPYTITEGLVLSVTPQISKDRWIMLDISPIITRITEIVTSTQGSTAPVLDIKQASTLVRARDGEMIILGGLIQNELTSTSRQVPFFSKIPFIGKLFEGDYSTKAKKELIIFLVPRLVI